MIFIDGTWVVVNLIVSVEAQQVWRPPRSWSVARGTALGATVATPSSVWCGEAMQRTFFYPPGAPCTPPSPLSALQPVHYRLSQCNRVYWIAVYGNSKHSKLLLGSAIKNNKFLKVLTSQNKFKVCPGIWHSSLPVKTPTSGHGLVPICTRPYIAIQVVSKQMQLISNKTQPLNTVSYTFHNNNSMLRSNLILSE